MKHRLVTNISIDAAQIAGLACGRPPQAAGAQGTSQRVTWANASFCQLDGKVIKVSGAATVSD